MSQVIVNSLKTLDQRRAAHAWARVQAAKTHSDKGNEYAGEAKKLPVRIMAAGLGSALAFILAKAQDKKRNLTALHDDLTDWIVKGRGMKAAKPGSLLESIIAGNSEFLRRVTDESLAYLQWLNRFAEAEGLSQ